jgi:hypothetical protein
MSVFREVEIKWGGKAYNVTPSNKLLRRIEREVPLVSYLGRASTDVLASETAFILCEFIRSAGGVASEDEIYSELMADFYENQGKGYFAIAGQVCDAIVPPSALKNLPAPEEKPGQEKKAATE